MTFECRVLRTEKSREYAWYRIEANTEAEAYDTLFEHLRENGTDEDLDGECLDWSFVDGETEDWEIGDITPVRTP